MEGKIPIDALLNKQKQRVIITLGTDTSILKSEIGDKFVDIVENTMTMTFGLEISRLSCDKGDHDYLQDYSHHTVN